MKNVDLRLNHIEELVRKINKRVRGILETRDHYLREKGKRSEPTLTRLRVLVKKLEKLELVLGNTYLTREAKDGERRCTVLFTQYERLKLKQMLEPDFRHVFRCSAADAEKLRRLIDGFGVVEKFNVEVDKALR